MITDRGNPYIPQLDATVGIGLVGLSAVGIAYVAIGDITGVGVADDFLLAPLSAGVGKG